ncbi:MAG: radical SAM protein, partial [Lachnospiraceae bacterium]|nr:radical SAM protein [Lachnospiraceae bacterium]
MTNTETKLEQLNRDFCGKKIKHCPFLGHTLNFDYGILNFCCTSTIDKMPAICNSATLESGSLKDIFISKLIDTIRSNQTEGPCTGCNHLREMKFEGLGSNTMRLSSITWNNYRRCNAGCVYCFQDQNEERTPYPAYQFAEQLYEQGFIEKNAMLFFGGGEPSMLPNLNDYLEFGYRYQLEQLLNTSAIKYSREIYNGLTKNLSVQISPDSGTRETYRRIKRRDCFETVWDTISRYCDFPESVRVKYIVFSWNSSQADLDGFVE